MLADDPAAPLDQHWRQHWHQHDLAVPWYLRAQGACTAAPRCGAVRCAPGNVQHAMPPYRADEPQRRPLAAPSLAIIHEAIACA